MKSRAFAVKHGATEAQGKGKTSSKFSQAAEQESDQDVTPPTPETPVLFLVQQGFLPMTSRVSASLSFVLFSGF